MSLIFGIAALILLCGAIGQGLRLAKGLTQLRHGRLKTFAAQKHCSFLR